MLTPALIRVPSNEKCSSDRSACTRGRVSTAVLKAAALSPSSSRARFLLDTVGTQTGSSTESPTNHRNARF